MLTTSISSQSDESSAVGPVPNAPAAAATSRKLNALRIAAALGFAIPNLMLVVHVSADGWAPADYFGAWVATLPSAQLLVDLALTSLAFIGWAAVDGRRLGLRWWLTIPATLLVGICFAVPLYLLMRETSLQASGDPSNNLRTEETTHA